MTSKASSPPGASPPEVPSVLHERVSEQHRRRIETLTPEEEAECARCAAEWMAIGLSTEPANRPEAERGVHLAYQLAGHKPLPPYVCCPCEKPYTEPGTCTACGGELVRSIQWADSPDAAVQLASKLVGGQPSSHLAGFVYGQHASGWLSFYEAWGRLGTDVHEIEGICTVARHAGWWLPFEMLVIICERPSVQTIDAEQRLHSDTGPAVRWAGDGFEIHAVHGVQVPAFVVEAPETITWQMIDSERNTEVRRVMLGRYGTARYIQDSGAKMIHSDSFGELYRKELPEDEPVVMVRVVNATPENCLPGTWHWKRSIPGEDGGEVVTSDEELRGLAWAHFLTGKQPPGYRFFKLAPIVDGREPRYEFAEPVYKDYWIRVPPTMTTAHQAVAWTFDRTPESYNPSAQT